MIARALLIGALVLPVAACTQGHFNPEHCVPFDSPLSDRFRPVTAQERLRYGGLATDYRRHAPKSYRSTITPVTILEEPSSGVTIVAFEIAGMRDQYPLYFLDRRGNIFERKLYSAIARCAR